MAATRATDPLRARRDDGIRAGSVASTLMSETHSNPRVGVACLVTRSGRLLLLKRQRSHGSGSWSPPGGHLDFGETLEACAIRETLEETGLHVADPEFFAITNDIFASDGKHYV